MNVILLSGGSGRRLWPLSNEVRSKQFIKAFRTADGEYESMLQRVYRQLRAVDSAASVTVATGVAQVSSICSQLGQAVDISVEPARRDTFPAIALACAYLADVKKLPPDEPVVVCPVDPYVEDGYFRALSRLSDLVAQGTANLSLLGVTPTYPSEKYGYIIPAQVAEVSAVSMFREKPNEATARQYIEQGALWNGGVFAFRLSYLLERAHALLDFTDYYDLYARYDEQTRISFDYAVAEHEKSIQVLRYNGQWRDLGTWNTFTEVMDEPAVGKVTLDDTCRNTHVINELNIPVLCMGCDDQVVVAGPDGILVADKHQSSYLKPYADKLTEQVRYAEKSWGSFTVLDVQSESMTIRVVLNPGHSMRYHSHERRDEVWTVISGDGIVCLDGMEQYVRVGEVVTLDALCKHTVTAGANGLTLIEVQLGRDISVEDKTVYER